MKSIFNDFGESLFLIFLGIGVFFFVRNPAPVSPENTNFHKGVLADYPKERTKEGSHSIGIWMSGDDNFYEFSSCSHNDRIAEIVKKLKPGDEVSFYSLKGNSSITFPWTGKKYKTYKICDATSTQYGRIVSFEYYNRCHEFQANSMLPALCGLLVLMGLYRLVRKVKDRDNKAALISSTWKIGVVREDAVIKVKPDRLTYVLRNSSLSFIFIVSGIFFSYPFSPEDLDMLGIGFVLTGIYLIFHYTLIHDKIYYQIDAAGIHIRNVSFLFQAEMELIRYDSIEDIFYRQAFYESPKNIGTILIDSGNTNSDGEKLYSKIIGIENYEEITRLILARTGIKN